MTRNQVEQRTKKKRIRTYLRNGFHDVCTIFMYVSVFVTLLALSVFFFRICIDERRTVDVCRSIAILRGESIL